jgi:hypothetical protein
MEILVQWGLKIIGSGKCYNWMPQHHWMWGCLYDVQNYQVYTLVIRDACMFFSISCGNVQESVFHQKSFLYRCQRLWYWELTTKIFQKWARPLTKSLTELEYYAVIMTTLTINCVFFIHSSYIGLILFVAQKRHKKWQWLLARWWCWFFNAKLGQEVLQSQIQE